MYTFIFISILTLCVVPPACSTLVDVTKDSFGNLSDGILAAFGDFDSDKRTDLFVISENGRSVSLYLAHTEGEFSRTSLLSSQRLNGSIVQGIVPTDFDGDSQMDIMVTTKKSDTSSSTVTATIYWGLADSYALEESLVVTTELRDQPLVMDCNGDMIPDLFGEVNGQRYFWQLSKDRNVTEIEFESPEMAADLLFVPQSSAFVDLNGDLSPDLLVVSRIEEDIQLHIQFEYWFYQNGKFVHNKTVPEPTIDESVGYISHVGQVIVFDLDQDSIQDLVLPVCLDDACRRSDIYVYTHDQWHSLSVSFFHDDAPWGFVLPKDNPLTEIKTPITLRVGDFDLDGYPDLLAVLGNKNVTGSPRQYPFLLSNSECEKGSPCEGVGRTFIVDWDSQLRSTPGVTMSAAFYDLEENGNLDVLMTTYTEDTAHLRAFKRDTQDNSCFLKVMVVTGLCNGACPHGVESYGVNQIGASTRYATRKNTGEAQTSQSSQLTQSAYSPLQLPYTVYGLGETPNFVDTLTVGVQHPTGETDVTRSWSYLIPNSQLIIIPYPHDDTKSWKSKLYVTPSQIILITGAALFGTCGFVAGIVGILHWREKVEDKKEKLQEAQRFHFDAM